MNVLKIFRRIPWYFCAKIALNKWLPSKTLRILILKFGGVKFGKNCHVGKYVCFDSIDGSKFEFGNEVVITTGCVLLIHSINSDKYGNWIWKEGNLKVGNHVFMGSHSVITRPISIGDNVIIAAGSIVTEDIPSNCVVAGVPAKIIKRFITNET